MAQDLDEFVTIAHPDIDSTAKVTREALNLVYEEKGWYETSSLEAEIPGYSSMSKAELQDVAQARGMTLDEGATKAEIVASLEASAGGA